MRDGKSRSAVTRRIAELLEKAARHHTPVGICGQAPSDHPDFATSARVPTATP